MSIESPKSPKQTRSLEELQPPTNIFEGKKNAPEQDREELRRLVGQVEAASREASARARIDEAERRLNLEGGLDIAA